MVVRWLLASIHLLALGVGLGAILARARALQGKLDSAGLRRLFAADTWWGVSAVLWIGTGLARVLGGLEKSTEYYVGNHVFWAKMALLLVVILLEVPPMITFIRWRVAHREGQQLDTHRARRFARLSYVQAVIIILMVFAATAMARGIGFPRP
jgi:putative membrane protein